MKIFTVSLLILTFIFPILVSSQDTGNEFCDAVNLDCIDQGETVKLKITLKKQSNSNGVAVGGSNDDNITDCTDVYNSGQTKSGVYSIRPRQLSKPIQVSLTFHLSMWQYSLT